jgi:hypothetical protein
MEYFNTISWLVIAKDRSKSIYEQNLLLLDDKLSIPSISLLYGESIESKFFELSEKTIKYSNGWIQKNLIDINSVNQEGVICDFLYSSVLLFMPNLNKIGTFYSLKEIEERNIILNGRIRNCITRESSRPF